MKKTLFYYSQLPNDKMKIFYLAVLKSVREQKDSAFVSGSFLTGDEIQRVLRSIDRDYPELFYVEFFGEGCTFTIYVNGDREVKFRYRYSESEQLRRIDENRQFIQYMSSRIPQSVRGSEYRIALWLHDLIAMNVEYDHAAAEAQGDDRHEEAFSIEGCLSGKKAVCSGIARLYMMLCEYMNLWCTYIAGPTFQKMEDREKNIAKSLHRHAWNLLRFEESYTYVDVTWDLQDGSSIDVSHTYFGMSDQQCRRQHEPENEDGSICIPLCPEPNPMNYYVRKQRCFQSSRELEQFINLQVKKRKKNFAFQLHSNGLPHKVLAERTRKFVNKMLNQPSLPTKSWKCWSNEPMLVFRYEISYC